MTQQPYRIRLIKKAGKRIASLMEKNSKRERNLIWNMTQVPSGKNHEHPTDWVHIWILYVLMFQK